MAAIRSVFLAAALGSAVLMPVHGLAQKPPLAVAASPAQRLAGLAERYYEEQARFEPVGATFNGDNRFDHLLPMTLAPSVRARQFAMLHDVLEELMRIDRSKLAPSDMVTFDILADEVNGLLRFESMRDQLMPMNQMDSLPVQLANFGSGQGSQPIGTVPQYQAYLSRLNGLPAWVDAAIANMRTGMKEGVVLPKAIVVAMLPQFKALAAASTDKSDFYSAIAAMPASFTAGEQARLKGAYRQAVGGKVLPAMRKLVAFLEKDYLPAARASAGWGALPNGAAWYRAWVAEQTTTSLSPDEIHRIGVGEMTRIQGELARLGPRLGYTGPATGLAHWLGQQQKFCPFKTEEDVLQSYRALNARILPLLPTLFATLPKAPLEIRPEPPLSRDAASDHYTLAAADGSRPGIFWAVIPDPQAYGSTRMTSLFLHEGHPGHHFQLSRQQDLSVPKFRKFGGNNAYVEGWALYAETLGKEMGLYEDPNAYAGHLLLDLRRAARLVVDTGLHAKGWTREQTIAYLMEQAGDAEADAINATERYMALPAQALGYKIGALKIQELRQRATLELGPKFSLARFHDAILAEGSMPLGLLETRMNAWIAAQAK